MVSVTRVDRGSKYILLAHTGFGERASHLRSVQSRIAIFIYICIYCTCVDFAL